jgi:DNA polymerase-3 subunit gamma/tau
MVVPAEDRVRGQALPEEGAKHGPVTRDEPVTYGAAPQAQLAPLRSPPRPEVAPEPAGIRLRRFEDVLALAGERRELALKGALERDVRLVRFEEGRIEFALAEHGSTTLPNELSRALNGWTGRRWMVALSSEPGDATVEERRKLQREERRSGAESHPLVRTVLASFPGAEIVDVRDRAPPEPMPAASIAPLVEGDVLPDDSPTTSEPAHEDLRRCATSWD